MCNYRIYSSWYFNYNNESKRVGKSIKIGADYSISDQLELNTEIHYSINVHTGLDSQKIMLLTDSIRVMLLTDSIGVTSDEDFNDNYNFGMNNNIT